jgi:hypothetical protein
MSDSEVKEGVYLAFDPGTTTGMVMFDAKGDSIRMGQFSLDELGEFLQHLSDPIKVVICEEFKIFKHKTRAFAGNRMEVSQAIGIIREFVRQRKIELVYQPPLIKTAAERLTGHHVSGNHNNSHWQDAYLHGKFYLIQHKIAKSALQLRHEEEQRGKV